MIVVRCTNGAVLFAISHRDGITPRVLTCINDGLRFTLDRQSRAAYLASLETAVAHAVALKGAIQQVAQLDIDP